MKASIAAVMTGALLAALAACATPTGPQALTSFDRVEGEVRDFTGYDRVYLAPIEPGPDLLDRVDARSLSPADREVPIDRRDIDLKIADLRADLEASLSEVATLVEAPGPGVLTIDVTLTALKSNRPTMAEMREQPALDFSSISTGDAAVEIELSEGGRTLTVLKDRAFTRQLNDPVIQAGIWATADWYFERLSRNVAALLR